MEFLLPSHHHAAPDPWIIVDVSRLIEQLVRADERRIAIAALRAEPQKRRVFSLSIISVGGDL
jgi:hypothetical protein